MPVVLGRVLAAAVGLAAFWGIPANADEVLAFAESGRGIGYLRLEVHNTGDRDDGWERGEINDLQLSLASERGRRLVFTGDVAAPPGWACRALADSAYCWTSVPGGGNDPIAPGELREFAFLVAARGRAGVPFGALRGIEWKTARFICSEPDPGHGGVCWGVGLDSGTVERVLQEGSKR